MSSGSLCKCDDPNCPVKSMTEQEVFDYMMYQKVPTRFTSQFSPSASSFPGFTGIPQPSSSTPNTSNSVYDLLSTLLKQSANEASKQFPSQTPSQTPQTPNQSGFRFPSTPSTSSSFGIMGYMMDASGNMTPIETNGGQTNPTSSYSFTDLLSMLGASPASETPEEFVKRKNALENSNGYVLVERRESAEQMKLVYVKKEDYDRTPNVETHLDKARIIGLSFDKYPESAEASRSLELYKPTNASARNNDCGCGSPDCPSTYYSRDYQSQAEARAMKDRVCICGCNPAPYDLYCKNCGVLLVKSSLEEYQKITNVIQGIVKLRANEESNPAAYIARVDQQMREKSLVPVLRTLSEVPGYFQVCYAKQSMCDSTKLTQEQLEKATLWPIQCSLLMLSSLMKIELYKFTQNNCKSQDALSSLHSLNDFGKTNDCQCGHPECPYGIANRQKKYPTDESSSSSSSSDDESSNDESTDTNEETPVVTTQDHPQVAQEQVLEPQVAEPQVAEPQVAEEQVLEPQASEISTRTA